MEDNPTLCPSGGLGSDGISEMTMMSQIVCPIDNARICLHNFVTIIMSEDADYVWMALSACNSI